MINTNVTVNAKYTVDINDKHLILTEIEARQLYYELQRALGIGLQVYPYRNTTGTGILANSSAGNPNQFRSVITNINSHTPLLSTNNNTSTLVYSSNQ